MVSEKLNLFYLEEKGRKAFPRLIKYLLDCMVYVFAFKGMALLESSWILLLIPKQKLHSKAAWKAGVVRSFERKTRQKNQTTIFLFFSFMLWNISVPYS